MEQAQVFLPPLAGVAVGTAAALHRVAIRVKAVIGNHAARSIDRVADRAESVTEEGTLLTPGDGVEAAG